MGSSITPRSAARRRSSSSSSGGSSVSTISPSGSPVEVARAQVDVGEVALVETDELRRELRRPAGEQRAGAPSRTDRACRRGPSAHRSSAGSARRRRTTTGRAGLSTSATPAGSSARGGTLRDESLADDLGDLVDRRLAREPGGLPMPAAVEEPRDRGDVELVDARAQRDSPQRARRRAAARGSALPARRLRPRAGSR